MRWLIFILLFSCGKHEEPKTRDMRDSDGDQIVNSQESEIDKYIANVETIGKVRGKLRFQHEKIIEVDLENQFQTAEKIITGPEKQVVETNYFAEGRKIKVLNQAKLDYRAIFYSVYLEFTEYSNQPDEVKLIHDKRQIDLGKWTPNMKVELLAADLKALMEGNAYFLLGKKFNRQIFYQVDADESIKEKTYRVYFTDGKKSEILYISKELDEENLLKGLRIKSAQKIHEDEFFFNPKEIGPDTWYIRDFANGDKVIALAQYQKLIKLFKDRFLIQKTVISRENGYAQKALNLSNPSLTPTYLRVRPTRQLRTFKKSVSKKYIGEGGGGGREGGNGSRSLCHYNYLTFANQQQYTANMNEVLEVLSISADGNLVLIDLNEDKIQEQRDEKGFYLDFKLNLKNVNLTLNLQNSLPDTYKSTGLLNYSCTNGTHAQPKADSTNIEAKFNLEIESYVEKAN